MDNSHSSLQSNFLSKGWKYFVVVGVVIALAGVGAISLPIFAGVTISTVVGVVLLFSGIAQAYHAFSIHTWNEKLWYVLSALLYLVGGLFIVFKPLAGLVTITMLIVIVMILNGLTRILFGLSNRSLPSSNVIILSGVLSVLIGGYFFMLLDDPAFSTTLLGTFVGISLLIEGIGFTFIGLKIKKSM
ncbi:HdeD family acid-resistance protein [Vibrio sp. 10N.261.51.F12]|uniref:HdeD family acid-resistance protein n=1 Tax=Vibrio sp. 10N.261.51.F12 TaxID=3229679 RepID=UPI00354F7008